MCLNTPEPTTSPTFTISSSISSSSTPSFSLQFTSGTTTSPSQSITVSQVEMSPSTSISITPSLSTTINVFSITNTISITPSVSIIPNTPTSSPQAILLAPIPPPSSNTPGVSPSKIPPQPSERVVEIEISESLSSSSSRSKTPSNGVIVPILVGNDNGDTIAEVIPPIGTSNDEFIIEIVSPPVFDETIRSDVISIELKSSIGQSTQLDEIEICIRSDGNEEKEDLCLGFLNENKNPPEWECQDECLKDSTTQNYGYQESLFCGTSDHLTNFALLLGGSNSNPCGESSQDYITGSYSGDLILVMCTIGAAIVFVILISSIGSAIIQTQKLKARKNTYVVDQTTE